MLHVYKCTGLDFVCNSSSSFVTHKYHFYQLIKAKPYPEQYTHQYIIVSFLIFISPLEILHRVET